MIQLSNGKHVSEYSTMLNIIFKMNLIVKNSAQLNKLNSVPN